MSDSPKVAAGGAIAGLPDSLAAALRAVAVDIEWARLEIEADRTVNLAALPTQVDAICREIAALPAGQRKRGLPHLAALVEALDRLYGLIDRRRAALAERLTRIDRTSP